MRRDKNVFLICNLKKSNRTYPDTNCTYPDKECGLTKLDDNKGGSIYFCLHSCLEMIRKNPEFLAIKRRVDKRRMEKIETTRLIINDGIPEISCPYCGNKIYGYLAMKARRVSHCVMCNQFYRVKRGSKNAKV